MAYWDTSQSKYVIEEHGHPYGVQLTGMQKNFECVPYM